MFDIEENRKLMQRAKEAEWYETPSWAAERILDYEILTARIIDPCAGRGVLGRAVRKAGYDGEGSHLYEYDLQSWPNRDVRIITGVDWLSDPWFDTLKDWGDFTVIMNPPFSKACEFVDAAMERGARKILMFQRFSFMESSARRSWFDKNPSARVWLCGDRAHCWRGDVPEEDILDENGEVIVKGKKGRSSPTAHAWFVWERGHLGSMTVQRMYKA